MRGIELDINGAGAGGANVRVGIPPPGFVCDRREWPLNTESLSAQGPNPVRATGEALFQRLETANHEIAGAINGLLDLPAAEVNPLYLRINDAQAATLPWETLYVKDDFVALQPAWPIARITDPAGRLPDADFVAPPELKVLAVLSALGEHACDEWLALRKAVADARTAVPPLNVKLALLIGEPDLRREIQKEIDGGTDFVSVDEIPPTTARLLERLQSETPHFVHLYCHGSVEPTRRLHFATNSEWLAWREEDKGTGSINVSIDSLAQATVNGRSWLVVINACKSATAGAQQDSLASGLVRQGVPAAVGHRQAISPLDAHRFASEFYWSLFRIVSREFERGGRREIEWAEALHAPRSGLQVRHGDAANSENWSVPILYVGSMAFKVTIVDNKDEVPAASRESAQKGVLAEALSAVAALDVPAEVIDAVLEPLDPGSAAELRADV
ncbi:CHAT domain-containing protein [Gordonia rhizosphera]|uniref:CHAT domain-containing protein n=1 Tax=Gordonia rhizosphera NBRC 16068 TaxID=1108045 RepID=K6W8S3_9ACTN|nr:CHAT domain-containing protein [Gordonia rhizosphera]GAB90146.1 hypothetical protein GORHZ_085_00130 [Gordonia rhizosphera NBRC 16068]